ncbi:MAG: amino acid ABC transporter permease [Mesosutterella sp.]|nr:amino acid ABC transporter permease [Mesosutterella sp.]
MKTLNFLSARTARGSAGWFSAGVTLLGVLMGAVLLWRFVQWGLADAVFRADAEACHRASGACWGFIAEKWRLIIFGRFPYEEQWRPAVGMAIILVMLVLTALPRFWNRKGVRFLVAGWAASLAVFFALMYGGIWGLEEVDSDSWGGLPLTVMLTLIGMTASAPIGILLALGRRSELPLVRNLCTAYIELVRGVPLITVLFVAAFVFPLLMPVGSESSTFWRVAVGIVLFQAAYMAETVRGGLQAIPTAQMAAAESLGLSRLQAYLYVLLPQALAAVIPAFVNSLLSTFMDTSLVTVVSMYDLLGSLRLALGDPVWREFFGIGYLFVGFIYFVTSFLMSWYSQWLEKRIKRGTVRA